MLRIVLPPTDRPPHRALATRAVAGALAALVVVALVAAGVGWLYLLYGVGAVPDGPPIGDALPLERLADHGAQPLLRLVVAWLPTGVAAGLLLAALTRLRRPGRALASALAAFVVLFLAGAAADAVTESDPLGPHLAPQLSRVATWIAVGLVLVGALLTPSRSSGPTRRWARAAGAMRLGAREPAGS